MADTVETRRRFRALPLLIALTATIFVASACVPVAISAPARKRIYLREVSHLRLASTPGRTLTERGSVTGTYSGTVVAYITTFSVGKGSFTFISHLSGGVVTMKGSTTNRNYTRTAYANGPGSITSGTGKFSHAFSNGLTLKAWMNRRNFSISSELTGWVTL